MRITILLISFIKLILCTTIDAMELPPEEKDTPACNSPSWAHECGRYENWPTLCADCEIIKIPVGAVGFWSLQTFSLGAIFHSKILLIIGASLSPFIPCCAVTCAGCCISTCADGLENHEILQQFKDGQNEGLKNTSCRKYIDARCNNLAT
jgi:hypothetical protein